MLRRFVYPVALTTLLATLGCGEEAPVWSSIPTVVLSPGGTSTVDLDDYVQDPDGSDDLLLLVVYGGGATTIQASIDPTTHVVTLRAASGYDGTVSFEVTATDPDGNTTSTTLLASTDSATPTPGGSVEARTCTTRFTYDTRGGTAATVNVAGTFNGWSATANGLSDPDRDGIWTGDITLAAGYHQYKFVINGTQWILDAGNPYQAWDGGFVNSEVEVDDCKNPQVRVVDVEVSGGRMQGYFQYVAGNGQTSYPASNPFELTVGGKTVSVDYSPITGEATFDIPATVDGKYTVSVRASGPGGKWSQIETLPMWVGTSNRAFDWSDAIAYFAMTDRFYNGTTSNDGKLSGVADAANYLGGDWQGITAKINEGYFNSLGVNVLWLSPVRDNPEHSEKGADGRSYSGYHGYWPQTDAMEEHFGGEAALKDLVTAAHNKGIRVMLDLVGNHVHDEHPWYGANSSWFNPYDWCNDGGSWDTNPLGCWFMDYLPDLNYQVPDAAHTMADTYQAMVRTYDLDAVRVDAVKHMEMVFTTRFSADMDQEFATADVPLYSVGETYVGTWDYNANPNDTYLAPQELIKQYIGQGKLDGQFDFPLYWEVIKTFARNEQGFDSLNAMVEDAEGYYGNDTLMSNFLGNHDVPRFISHANGNIADMWGNGAQEQGWTNPPAQPTAAAPYEKLRLGFTFLMTMPGIPLIYYGDEVGLAGAGDPDNRRLMPWSGLNTEMSTTRTFVQQLASIRGEHPALRSGNRSTLWADADGYAYARTSASDKLVVAMNKGSSNKTLTLTVSGVGLSDGTVLTDELGSGSVTVSGGKITVTLPARKAAIFAAP